MRAALRERKPHVRGRGAPAGIDAHAAGSVPVVATSAQRARSTCVAARAGPKTKPNATECFALPDALVRSSINRRFDLGDNEKAIARIIETYQSAVWAKDVEGLMRLYDRKVRVFDAWGVWSYENAESWQRTVESWFSSLGAERVKVSFDDVSVSDSRESAIVSAIVTYASVSPEGSTVRSMQNRLSWGLRTSGHVLRIIHEHTSAPIGFEDQKAILRRDAGEREQ
jgi:ketosteroid isomerase-like protein